MKIAIPKEQVAGEKRVAASPETVKKLTSQGFQVLIEKEAGLSSSFSDQSFEESGAILVADAISLYDQADIILSLNLPPEEKFSSLKANTILIGLLKPFQNSDNLQKLNERQITLFSLDLLPRITRAQNMDVLSSQSNLAGYKAVLDALEIYPRIVPMMMTAAGTIPPARFLILGAGVAGLQAIATAKRLGGIVFAFDVRVAVKEQVQSLGAKFVEVDSHENAETKAGYATEMDEDYKRRQAERIQDVLKATDIVITTALIPGKPAPILITEDMVKRMRPSSVIVDLAVETGGNCALSEKGKIVTKYGVTLVGHENVPSRLASDASTLYARNIYNFFKLLFDSKTNQPAFNFDDEILKQTCLCHQGTFHHPLFMSAKG